MFIPFHSLSCSGLGVRNAGEEQEMRTPDWRLQEMGQEILSWGVPIGPVILAFGAHCEEDGSPLVSNRFCFSLCLASMG